MGDMRADDQVARQDDDTRDASVPVQADDLTGKHVLISLSFCNGDGTLVRQVQRHGTIRRVTADVIEVHLAGSGEGETFTLPPDVEAFERAAPGEYRLQATGEVIRNPDLLTTWTITAPPDDPHRFERPDWREHVPGL